MEAKIAELQEQGRPGDWIYVLTQDRQLQILKYNYFGASEPTWHWTYNIENDIAVDKMVMQYSELEKVGAVLVEGSGR